MKILTSSPQTVFILRWGVYDVNPKAEPARPEYLAKLEEMTHVKTTYNVVTREVEHSPHFWWTRFVFLKINDWRGLYTININQPVLLLLDFQDWLSHG